MFLKSSVLLLTEVKSRVRTIKLRNWEATPSQKKKINKKYRYFEL